VGRPKTLVRDTDEDHKAAPVDPLCDALEATLALVENKTEPRTSLERLGQAPWFQLAAVVAGIVHPPETSERDADYGDLTRHRVARAYLATQLAAATGNEG
jgi:hypothetical protein